MNENKYMDQSSTDKSLIEYFECLHIDQDEGDEENETELNMESTGNDIDTSQEEKVSTLEIQKISLPSIEQSMKIEPLTSALVTTNQSGYIPKTISLNNLSPQSLAHIPILPPKTTEIFTNISPTSITLDDLLLANVPDSLLSPMQIFRRQHSCDGLIVYEKPSDSQKTKEETYVLYELFSCLSIQWRVPVVLLTYNYERMLAAMSQFKLEDFVRQMPTITWSLEEWKWALEFYLQMDVDCFYMKTCSFRESRPRKFIENGTSIDEGLFCVTQPEACYGMQRCGYQQCLFCYRRHRMTRFNELALHYSDRQIHTFVNHYQVYLNCNVTCSSKNVIYALTCPCGKYDYIGRTSGCFYKRLYYHRLQCSRIIREFLLGERIVNRFRSRLTISDKISKNDSKDLYRHIAHCPIAKQIFLSFHFIYWCLIPMPNEVADIDDSTNNRSSFLVRTFTEEKFNQSQGTKDTRSDDMVFWCMGYLPNPPRNYRFSKRQRQEQYYFFKAKADLWPLCQHLDIYNASVIIAVPEQVSSLFLHYVQALLVTHAECKLNTVNPQLPSHFNRTSEEWCEQLHRPAD